MLLSRYRNQSERAVAIAYRTFRDIEVESILDLMRSRPVWKSGGRAINLNVELVQVLQKVIESIRRKTASEPKVVISSQGSFALAIGTFLERDDVVAQMARINIRIDPDSIVANRLEVMDGRFTGKLTAPVITKYNRLKLFPKNSVFIGDDKDEAVLRRMARSRVKFVNHKKPATRQNLLSD